MKRSLLILAVAGWAAASGPYDQKLSPDQQIIHALNRLTFGPRPGRCRRGAAHRPE